MDAFADTVLQLVGDWLRAVYRRESRAIDRDLDHAGWESFPASDPIAPYHAMTRGERVHELRLTIGRARLELARPPDEPSGSQAQPRPANARRIEGTTPEGETVRIEVIVDDEAASHLASPAGSKLAAFLRPEAAGASTPRAGDEAPRTPPEHA